MKHLGDIKKLKGSEVPLVDVIIGGSPCQDLSVAGKRAGLDGERSGLFMEQIRIIKEMRKYDIEHNGRDERTARPRWMVFENVAGLFSSNGGDDFRTVLEEVARVRENGVNVPRPAGGRWKHSGIILGDDWSIAWILRDAQYWGVPQRRKRIALVADFGGQCAPEVCFECDGLQGYSAESYAAWKRHTEQISAALGGSDSAGASDGLVGTTVSWDNQDISGTLSERNAGGAQRMPDKQNFNCVIEHNDSAEVTNVPS